MLKTLANNLTREERQNFALVPPGFQSPLEVVCNDGVSRPGIVLPLYQMSLLHHLTELNPTAAEISKINFPAPELVQLSIQIALSLQALHRLDIVHTDLKPANILLNLTESGIIVALTNFGSAKRQGQTFDSSTQFYLPPECINGSRVTTKFDIYSFGVTLAQIVYQVAFDLSKKLPSTISHSESKLPIDKLISRCLHQNPANRPTVEELIEELAKIKRELPAPNRHIWQMSTFYYLAFFGALGVFLICCFCPRGRSLGLKL